MRSFFYNENPFSGRRASIYQNRSQDLSMILRSINDSTTYCISTLQQTRSNYMGSFDYKNGVMIRYAENRPSQCNMKLFIKYMKKKYGFLWAYALLFVVSVMVYYNILDCLCYNWNLFHWFLSYKWQNLQVHFMMVFNFQNMRLTDKK